MSISQHELKERMSYDPETGTFAWKIQPRGQVRLDSINGCPVGTLSNGRLVVGLNKKLYTAARLAWLYVYGELPAGNLYHRDNNPLNVAIDNLYLRNTKARPRRKTVKDEWTIYRDGEYKVRGVTQARGQWVARPTINGKRVYLGQFTTQKEAEQAVKRAIRDAKNNA